MEILRKITIKSCGDFTQARVREVIAKTVSPKTGKPGLEDGESVAIIRVVGTASGAKSGQTEKGTYTKLAGNFVGTDLTTGALYQSGQCILPEFVGAQLGAALLGGGAEGVDFAFEITAKRDDSAVTGYSYGVKPLIETKASDKMTELMAKAGIALPSANAPAALANNAAPAAAPAAPAAAPAAPAAAPAAPAKSAGKK